jgi:hypothetical protein
MESTELTGTGLKRDRKKTNLKRNVKLPRLVSKLLRNKSKLVKSRNRRRRPVKRRLRRKLRKRKPNLPRKEQS